MAITRTAKGTNADKTAGTTLTVAGVSMTAGDLIVVGTGYETDAGITSVNWGNSRDFKLVAQSGVTQGDTRNRLYRLRAKRTATRDVDITWAGTMSARAMFVSSLTDVGRKDVGQTNTQTATGSPATGSAVTSTVADTISIASFVSLGPLNDTPGTAGVGHTLGQRDGTNGAPPTSNVTIQETYEILSATGNVRATLSGATARDWANTIIAFAARSTYTVDDVYQPLNTLVHGDNIVFVMSNSEASDLIHVSFPINTFDTLTDTEVEEQINDYCIKHAEHILEGPESNPVGEATRNTRMATFVNDTFVV